MMSKLKKRIKEMGYAGVTKEVFHSCMKEIEEHNTTVLGFILLLSIGMLGIFSLSSLLIPGFSDMMPYYMLFCIFSIVYYCIYRKIRANGDRCCFLQCYVQIGLLFLFCLIKEVFIHTQWPGTLFHIVLIGTFALFIMPFWYEVCFCGSISIIYLLCAYWIKEPAVFQLEMANVIVTFGLAALVAYVVDRERINYMLSKKQLTNSSIIDELTGVYNRRDFNEHVIASYNVEQRMALLMMDVDNFKSYNDTYGHLAGDACLRQIGEVLRKVAHASDCYVARYGGEEFVILGEGKELQEIRQIGWKVVSEVRKLNIENVNSPLGIITISAGASEKDERRMKAYTDLIREADQALYQAKETGKNRVEILEQA